jgi:hypothetical protein
MTGWNFDSQSKSDTKHNFTKFPVGITRIRIVDEEPFQRWTHWMPQFKRSINCPGKGCPICEIRKNQKANKEKETYSTANRIAIQVLNRETGKLEIMEQGRTFFEDLRDIMEELHDNNKKLIDVDIKVKRRGEGKDDTSYRLDIDKEYPLTEEDKKLINNKINLSELFKPHDIDKILRLLNGEKWEDVMYENNESNDDEVVEVS